MSITTFLHHIKSKPAQIKFADTMAVVDQHYTFTEVAFDNGQQKNQAGENSGSCKLFAFAQEHHLDKEQTLLCFGEYYQDVLNTPDGNDHQNIRQFIINGWDGIHFSAQALHLRENDS